MEAERLVTEARPDLAQDKMVTVGTKRKGTGLKIDVGTMLARLVCWRQGVLVSMWWYKEMTEPRLAPQFWI